MGAAFIDKMLFHYLKEVPLFRLKEKHFSTKAIELTTKSNTEKTILCIAPNSFGLIETGGSCTIEKIDFCSNQGVYLLMGKKLQVEKFQSRKLRL